MPSSSSSTVFLRADDAAFLVARLALSTVCSMVDRAHLAQCHGRPRLRQSVRPRAADMDLEGLT